MINYNRPGMVKTIGLSSNYILSFAEVLDLDDFRKANHINTFPQDEHFDLLIC